MNIKGWQATMRRRKSAERDCDKRWTLWDPSWDSWTRSREVWKRKHREGIVDKEQSVPPKTVLGGKLDQCAACKSVKDQHLMTQCGFCEHRYHLACLSPPLAKWVPTFLYYWIQDHLDLAMHVICTCAGCFATWNSGHGSAMNVTARKSAALTFLRR